MDVRNQLEVRDVTRPDDGEVSAIDRGDGGGPEPLGSGDHHRINCSQREVAVGDNQFCASPVVGKKERLHLELSACDRFEEISFEVGRYMTIEHPAHFDDDASGNDQLLAALLDKSGAGTVVAIIDVDSGDEHAAADDNHLSSSALRISSTRSERS